MKSFFRTRKAVPVAEGWQEDVKVLPHLQDVHLDGLHVLIMTSGHEATDPRIYAKQACSLQDLGADVTVVGMLEHNAPGKVAVLTVRKPSSRLARFLWQPWRCIWAARRHRADIIHFHDAEMLITLPLAKLWWGRSKFVYDVHEDFGNLMLVRDWLPSWMKPVVRVLTDTVEKGLASLADAIVGVTPPLADKFRHRNRIVAYNYPAKEFFDRATKAKQQSQNRDFDLVHLGTLNLRRAIFLADVIKEFHQLQPGARSLVIGVPADIEAAIKGLIPDGCVLLGKTPYDEVTRLLGNAKVGLDVHPWLAPHLEVALPVKVCEYMAAGCAVVASSMPVLKQILARTEADEDAITLIEGGKPIDYARAVAHLVKVIAQGADPGSRLCELARKHLIWDEEVANIARLYRELLQKPCAT